MNPSGLWAESNQISPTHPLMESRFPLVNEMIECLHVVETFKKRIQPLGTDPHPICKKSDENLRAMSASTERTINHSSVRGFGKNASRAGYRHMA